MLSTVSPLILTQPSLHTVLLEFWVAVGISYEEQRWFNKIHVLNPKWSSLYIIHSELNKRHSFTIFFCSVEALCLILHKKCWFWFLGMPSKWGYYRLSPHCIQMEGITGWSPLDFLISQQQTYHTVSYANGKRKRMPRMLGGGFQYIMSSTQCLFTPNQIMLH